MVGRMVSGRRLGRVTALALALSGCGPMHFSYHSVRASRHLEQARHMDAEHFAPYELEVAELHLDKAKEEAGKAEYQDAVALARIANEHARKAVEVTREQRDKQGSEN